MSSIMVINAKGGSGKTTISTNLASYFATNGYNVTLVDLDPQDLLPNGYQLDHDKGEN